jgi:hypothetical protein
MQAEEKNTNEYPRIQYNAPELKIYGDVASLTQANANMSSTGDGGTGSNKKTA